MLVIRWQGEKKPRVDELRERLCQEGLTPYMWSSAPGDFYAVHSHRYEAILYCAQGSICFALPDTLDENGNNVAVTLNPGDQLILPASTRHSARVGRTGVICLEASRVLAK